MNVINTEIINKLITKVARNITKIIQINMYTISAQKLVRNHPGRKSLKDIFRSSIKLENGFSKISSSDKKEKEFLHEKIQKSEKEIKKLEEKYTQRVGESDELEKIKKLIKMEETTLNRLKKELGKFGKGKQNFRALK